MSATWKLSTHALLLHETITSGTRVTSNYRSAFMGTRNMTVIDILEKRLVFGITRLICVALLCIALASLVAVVWASFAGGRTVPAVSDPVVGA